MCKEETKGGVKIESRGTQPTCKEGMDRGGKLRGCV